MRFGLQPTRNGEAVFYGIRRDRDRRPFMLLENSEVQFLELDFSNYVETSETLSTITLATENLIANVSGTGLKRSVLINGPSGEGYITITVTFSTGAKWVERIHVRNRVREATSDLSCSDYSRYGTA